MKQPYVIVLAGNSREGRRYAKLAGLPKGRHRVVYSAKQVRNLRHAEVHELPSFARRPDRHGINAALRYTRGERIQVEMPDVDDPRGELTARQLEVAYRFNALREARRKQALEDFRLSEMVGDTPIAPPETVLSLEDALAEAYPEVGGRAELEELATAAKLDEDGEPVEPKAPIRRRRSRCKVCDALVFGDDDPAHNVELHEAQDGKVLGKPSLTNFFGSGGE